MALQEKKEATQPVQVFIRDPLLQGGDICLDSPPVAQDDKAKMLTQSVKVLRCEGILRHRNPLKLPWPAPGSGESYSTLCCLSFHLRL